MLLKKNKEYILFLVCIMAMLGIGELIFRYVAPIQYFFERDAQLDWVRSPQSDDIDGVHLGFRENYFDLDNISSDELVYAVGDSFLFSAELPYEKNWMTIADQRMPRYNIINLGVSGYDVNRYAILAKRFVDQKKPRAIVLSFFVGNDLHSTEFSEMEYFLNRFAGLRPSEVQSYFFEAVRVAVKRMAYSFSRLVNDDLVYSDKQYREYMVGQARFAKKDLSTESTQSIDDTFDAMKSLIAFTRDRDTKLVVVVIPSVYQIDHELFREALAATGGAIDEYDIQKPQVLLREFLDEQNVPVIDLLQAFQDATNSSELFIYRDGHFTEQGHALAAKVLSEELPFYLEYEEE